MTFQYIPSNDTWYFPHKDIYIKRWMFIFATQDYLMDMLDLNMDKKQFADLMIQLSRVPDAKVINVTDY